MKFNLHTHTKYCRHASGEIEDYVLRAIEGGITHLGFSDHVPRRYSDGFERRWKVQTDEVYAYLGEIGDMKKKYNKDITIYVGYEAEYYPEEGDKLFEDARKNGAEYLILGEHFVSAEDERDESVNRHTVIASGSEERLIKYADVLIEAMSTGRFTYVAHPDIIGFNGDGEIYAREVRRICEASLLYDIPLEINLLGMRELREYPRKEFWQIAAEVGSPVTIGCDAHRPIDVCDKKSEKKALAMISELGLNYIGMPKLRPIL